MRSPFEQRISTCPHPNKLYNSILPGVLYPLIEREQQYLPLLPVIVYTINKNARIDMGGDEWPESSIALPLIPRALSAHHVREGLLSLCPHTLQEHEFLEIGL